MNGSQDQTDRHFRVDMKIRSAATSLVKLKQSSYKTYEFERTRG